jgi:excisionase family DNA binding protein
VPDATELLTLQDVAERLKVSRRTVEREIAAGRIRIVRVGRRIRVTTRELEAYIAAQRVRVA